MIEPVQAWPPIAGYYATSLVRNGPRVPVRIWFGPPVVDGEEQDRAPRWCVEIDGQTDRVERNDETGYRCRVALDPMAVWPYCAREPIDVATYRYMVAHGQWARDHSPGHPKAQPRQPIDFNTLPVRF